MAWYKNLNHYRGLKNTCYILLILFSPLVGSACEQEVHVPGNKNIQSTEEKNKDSMVTKITIKVGNNMFKAILLENASAKAFKAMLPLTLNMTELNGNEKYYRFSNNLPTQASNPGTIHSGDLMLWGSNTLVIFYETFSTHYNYTRLGKINNPSGLAKALGSGNVTVTIELE